MRLLTVILAKARISFLSSERRREIPAFAGMTVNVVPA